MLKLDGMKKPQNYFFGHPPCCVLVPFKSKQASGAIENGRDGPHAAKTVRTCSPVLMVMFVW